MPNVNQEQYVKGFPYHLRFGAFRGQNQNCAGMCLYGDVHAGVYYGDDHPEEAGYADHQKVSLWVEFERYRPYGIVEDLLRKSFEIFEPHGWKWAEAYDDIPGSWSGVDDLADTLHDPRFFNEEYKQETFPAEPSAQGNNAARGFFLKVERKDRSPEFSPEEVAQLETIMKQVMQLVFGHELPVLDLEVMTQDITAQDTKPPVDNEPFFQILTNLRELEDQLPQHSENQNQTDPGIVVKHAMDYIKQKYPEASQYKKAAFANSVQYCVTGWSGGYGGPSVREHAASHAVAHRGTLENGLYTFDEAVKILEHPDGVIFGPIQDVHRACYRNEHHFDDDPEDLEILERK